MTSCRDVNGAAVVGDTIIWETTASGGVGTLKYNYTLYRNGQFYDLSLFNTDNHYSYQTTEADSYYIEVTVRDSNGAEVEYTGDTVTITASTSPTIAPNGYEALAAPSTSAVPGSVGMTAVYTGVTSTTISVSLRIANTFNEGLTDYGLWWQPEGGSAVRSSVGFGDVSGAAFGMTISYLQPDTVYSVRGYVVKGGQLLLSEGFKVRTDS